LRAGQANTFDQRAEAADLPGRVLYILIPSAWLTVVMLFVAVCGAAARGDEPRTYGRAQRTSRARWTHRAGQAMPHPPRSPDAGQHRHGPRRLLTPGPRRPPIAEVLLLPAFGLEPVRGHLSPVASHHISTKPTFPGAGGKASGNPRWTAFKLRR